MRIEQYLTFTNHALWEVFVNADSVSLVASAGSKGHIPPKSKKHYDEHLLKFHVFKDTKSLWEAIKNSQEGLDKTNDKFKKLISQLEIHGEVIYPKDVNLKLLRSLPSAWNNIALIMRNKSDLDTLSMDDLYNNLKVYESEIKIQSSSSSNSHNVAFVSSNNTSSTNETVNTDYSFLTTSSKEQASIASYADDVIFSFFSNQSNAPELDNEDLEQIDTDDLEEKDLKWQVAMLTMRVKRRGHFTRECRAPSNQGNRNRDAPTRNAPVDTSTTNALVVQDGIGGYDWSFQAEEELAKFALMAYTSQDKTGLGYDGQMNESNLNDVHVNKSEVLNNVVDSHESDGDDNQANDSFKKSEGYHEVPPPYIGNYMPLRADLSFTGLDNFVFKSKESDSEDKNVFESKEVNKIDKPSLKKIEFVNARNTTVKNENKVLTKSRQVLVNAAKQSSHRATTSVSTAGHVNTAASRPNVNNTLPTTYYYFKAHSPVRMPFNQKSAAKTNNFNEKVNTAKLLDESQVLLKVPRNNNMYSFEFKNVVPVGGLTCLFAKAALDESNLWHRRLGHINFKTMNKHVRGNLVRGIENQMDHKINTIRCDNRTEFKNRIINEFYEIKGIRGEFSVARTPQQNGVTERKHKTLIETARTMLADSKLTTTLLAEVVNNACYDPAKEGDKNDQEKDVRDQEENLIKQFEQESKRLFGQGETTNTNSTTKLNIVSSPVNVVRYSFTTVDPGRERVQRNEFVSMSGQDKDANEDTADLQDTKIISGVYDDEVKGVKADFNKLELTTVVKPKKVNQALTDLSWIEVMQDELLQFRLQKVWRLVNLPKGKHAIGTKWVYRNKKDKRRIIVRNKAILVPQEQALYGLYQALRAWYETLSTYLLENGFRRGIIYKTLFIKKDKGDILLLQVYVDDIIFGSTKKSLCTKFEGLMHKKFQRSSIGELTFFLGLQVMQRDDGIFISQDKCVANILKKFNFSSVKRASTPIETNKALLKDKEAEDVDIHLYRSMIGSLTYLTASRHDKMFVVCSCARFQFTPKVLHLYAVKRIFRCLKGQPTLSLWYPRDSPFDLEAFSESDYAGASLDRKSTIEEKPIESEGFEQIIDFLNASYVKYTLTINPSVYTLCIKQFWATAKRKQKTRRKQMKETKAPSPSSEIPYEEGVPTTSNDPPPSGGDRMQLNELMILCTNLQKHGLLNEEEMFGVNDLDGDEVITDATTKLVKGSEKVAEGSDKEVEGSEKSEEGSSKRATWKIKQEDAKRQRLEEENESTDLKRCLEIVPEDDDDVAIEATPISSKSQPLLITRSTKKGGKAISRSSEKMEILKII
nr:uncharacterized mitochondrial protein AtMg00810-like [Tanacetum cinerariifolium]